MSATVVPLLDVDMDLERAEAITLEVRNKRILEEREALTLQQRQKLMLEREAHMRRTITAIFA